MQLEDIIPDFSDMSDEEIRDWLRKSRVSRFTSKEDGTRASQRPAAKKNKLENASAILDTLDPKQLALLLKMREEGKV